MEEGQRRKEGITALPEGFKDSFKEVMVLMILA